MTNNKSPRVNEPEGETKSRLELLTKIIVEALKLIRVKVGGAKESFPKGLNRSEHLAETSSYGLILDDSQDD